MIDEPQIVLELPGSIVVNSFSVFSSIMNLILKCSVLFVALLHSKVAELFLCIFIVFFLSLSIDTVKERQVRLVSKGS